MPSASFARTSKGSLIVTASPLATGLRELIVMLAALHELPAVYSNPLHAMSGGLVSYGLDRIDRYRQAAGSVDRVLKGENQRCRRPESMRRSSI